MKEIGKSRPKNTRLGEEAYINNDCWLDRTLGYHPYERCGHCELKFQNCLFLHYQIISSVLIIFFLILSFVIEGGVSIFGIIFLFTVIITYGYYFNKSTEGLIQASFAEIRAREALDKLNEDLEKKINLRTKELRRAYQELQVLDRAKTEFISIASHQLRTPLGIIRGYLSMLTQGDFGTFPPEADKAIQETYQASLRLLKLSNDLLNASQIDSGKLVLVYQKIKVKPFLLEIIAEMQSQADQKGLLLKLKIEKGVQEVKADCGKLRQVMINLIDNALKYTEKGGVEISASVDKGNILIEVSDTGSGIDKKDIGRLFQSFFRGRIGKNLNPAGTGLGLYIAQKFIDQHKGRIWVENDEHGKGAKFSIELPLSGAQIVTEA